MPRNQKNFYDNNAPCNAYCSCRCLACVYELHGGLWNSCPYRRRIRGYAYDGLLRICWGKRRFCKFCGKHGNNHGFDYYCILPCAKMVCKHKVVYDEFCSSYKACKSEGNRKCFDARIHLSFGRIFRDSAVCCYMDIIP